MTYRIKNIIYTLFIVFTVLFAIAFNNGTGWTLVYLLVPLTVSLVLVLYLPYHIDLLQGQWDVPRGEGFDVGFKLSRKRWLPQYQLLIQNDDVELLSTKATGFFKASLTCHIPAITLNRGIYTFTEVSLLISDPFGLLTRRIVIKKDVTLNIYPQRADEAADLLYNHLHETILKRSLYAFNDSFDLHKIRDYVAGDRINRIDWKLSSKTEVMQSRVYERDHIQPLELVFLCVEGSHFEYALAVFYALTMRLKDGVNLSISMISSDVNDDLTPRDFLTVKAVPQITSTLPKDAIILSGREIKNQMEQTVITIQRHQIQIHSKHANETISLNQRNEVRV